MKIAAFRLALILSLAALLPGRSDTPIAAGSTATAISAATAGAYTLNAGDTHTYTGSSTGGVTTANGSASDTLTFNINGSLVANATAGNAKTHGAALLINTTGTFDINVASGGLIESSSAGAIYVAGGLTGATVNLNNQGQIIGLNPAGGPESIDPSTGLAVNLTSLSVNGGSAVNVSNAGGGTIVNGSATNTGALMESFANEAVLLGSNQTLTNYGTIIGQAITGDSAKNNNQRTPAGSVTNTYSSSQGVDFGTGANDSLYNYGTISGNPHGVDMSTATNIYIENHGTIIGRNGSGIGGDTTSNAANNVTIVNYGLIQANYAGPNIDRSGAASTDGDPDGIDIDGGVTITNYGTIQTTAAAGGYDTNGRANLSDGLGIGGGVVNNYGSIVSAQAAVTVNNDGTAGSRSGGTPLTLTNYAGASIVGQSGYAIRSENQGAAGIDTVTNYGTISGGTAAPDASVVVTLENGTVDPVTGILNGVTYNANGTYTDGTGTHTGNARFVRGDGSAIQMGEGNDTLINGGTIIGVEGKAVNMEGGDDKVVILAGSKIIGLVDGGVGNNTLDYQLPGLTDAKKAALAAGQTVYLNGTPYVDFTDFTGSTTATFASLSHSAATRGVAAFFDNAGALGSNTAGLVSQAAAASDPDAALKQLTPTAFQNNTEAGVNTSTQTAQALGNRMANIRQGGGGSFDLSGFQLWDPTLAASFNNARSLLAGADLGRTVSDITGPVVAHTAEVEDPNAKRWGFFLSGNAIFGDQGANANAPGYNFTTAAAILGVDYRVNREITVGGFGGYSHTDANTDSFGSKSDITTGLLGGYASWTRHDWFVNGSVIYGRNAYDNTRMALGTENGSSPDGNQVAVLGSFGHDFKLGHWTLTPEAGGQYTAVFIDKFTESGPAALSVNADSADSLRSNVGGNARYDFATSWGRITPGVNASWQHEFLDGARNIQSSFADSPAAGSFSTTATGSGHDFGTVGASVEAQFAERWTATLSYDYQAGGRDFEAQEVAGGIRYAF